MRLIVILSVLLSASLLTGCSFNERVDGIVELTPDTANGMAIYDVECARCHASDGRGNDLGPNLVSELHHGDKQFLTWILDGLGDEMPAFPQLTDQEAADLMGYIHQLAE